jgi:hypothetical protein
VAVLKASIRAGVERRKVHAGAVGRSTTIAAVIRSSRTASGRKTGRFVAQEIETASNELSRITPSSKRVDTSRHRRSSRRTRRDPTAPLRHFWRLTAPVFSQTGVRVAASQLRRRGAAACIRRCSPRRLLRFRSRPPRCCTGRLDGPAAETGRRSRKVNMTSSGDRG